MNHSPSYLVKFPEDLELKSALPHMYSWWVWNSHY